MTDKIQFYEMVAYMVRFNVAGNEHAQVETLFNERWRAEAFRDGCTDQMNAKVIPLFEKK